MKRSELLDKIVDAALELGETTSWETVRLHRIAAHLEISLTEIQSVVREKEDLIDAWFDRADRAMLAASRQADVREADPNARLVALIMAWLNALKPYRRVTRQMIVGKLEPGHLHYQMQGALRVSRTVQWLREAAGREHTLPLRAIDEAALTGIYLAVFARWMYDSSPDSRYTRRFLERKLHFCDRFQHWCSCAPRTRPAPPKAHAS